MKSPLSPSNEGLQIPTFSIYTFLFLRLFLEFSYWSCGLAEERVPHPQNKHMKEWEGRKVGFSQGKWAEGAEPAEERQTWV